MKTMNRIMILAAVSMAAACTPAVELTDSTIELPDSYSTAASADTLTIADMSWEEFFPDTVLQRHIRTALEGNYSFRSCLDRVRLAENELRTASLGRTFRRSGKVRRIHHGRCRERDHQYARS